jgi:hypothetical protein
MTHDFPIRNVYTYMCVCVSACQGTSPLSVRRLVEEHACTSSQIHAYTHRYIHTCTGADLLHSLGDEYISGEDAVFFARLIATGELFLFAEASQ